MIMLKSSSKLISKFVTRIVTIRNCSSSKQIPEPPENCCMSGCPNCVWLTYAEELLKLYNDGGKKFRADLEEKINDPALRSFIELELQTKLNIDPYDNSKK